MQKKFSNQEIQRVLEQSSAYNCTCPAQVVKSINQQRSLFQYQMDCIDTTETDHIVHQTIATTAQLTHQLLEDCLHEVLTLEGWDLDTMSMPPALIEKYTQTFMDEV